MCEFLWEQTVQGKLQPYDKICCFSTTVSDHLDIINRVAKHYEGRVTFSREMQIPDGLARLVVTSYHPNPRSRTTMGGPPPYEGDWSESSIINFIEAYLLIQSRYSFAMVTRWFPGYCEYPVYSEVFDFTKIQEVPSVDVELVRVINKKRGSLNADVADPVPEATDGVASCWRKMGYHLVHEQVCEIVTDLFQEESCVHPLSSFPDLHFLQRFPECSMEGSEIGTEIILKFSEHSCQEDEILKELNDITPSQSTTFQYRWINLRGSRELNYLKIVDIKFNETSYKSVLPEEDLLIGLLGSTARNPFVFFCGLNRLLTWSGLVSNTILELPETWISYLRSVLPLLLVSNESVVNGGYLLLDSSAPGFSFENLPSLRILLENDVEVVLRPDQYCERLDDETYVMLFKFKKVEETENCMLTFGMRFMYLVHPVIDTMNSRIGLNLETSSRQLPSLFPPGTMGRPRPQRLVSDQEAFAEPIFVEEEDQEQL